MSGNYLPLFLDQYNINLKTGINYHQSIHKIRRACCGRRSLLVASGPFSFTLFRLRQCILSHPCADPELQKYADSTPCAHPHSLLHLLLGGNVPSPSTTVLLPAKLVLHSLLYSYFLLLLRQRQTNPQIDSDRYLAILGCCSIDGYAAVETTATAAAVAKIAVAVAVVTVAAMTVVAACGSSSQQAQQLSDCCCC